MSHSPVISIITVVRNRAGVLARAIESVTSQDYHDVEYIIIDGASTDGTQDVIRRYEKSLAFWTSEPDQGISDAFNKGIAKSKGALIGLLNADDEYLPQALSRVALMFHQSDGQSIIHGNLRVDAAGKSRRLAPRPFPRLWVYLDMPFNHPAMFVPRSIYDRIGAYNPDFHYAMDYDLVLRVMRANTRFIYLNADLTRFSLTGASSRRPPSCHREVLSSQRQNRLFMPACRLAFALKMTINRLKRVWRHE